MDSLKGCRWSVYQSDPGKVKVVADTMGVSPLFAKILIRRGLDSSEAISRHMAPSLGHIHDPYQMKGMDEAVERIVRAVEAREQVAIYGDYDADGITALSVLKLFLDSAPLPTVLWHIPDRINEGYGVHIPALEGMKSQGVTLVITVDCGITAVDEIAWACDNGIDVIVTDHHTPPETLPPALAIVNPKCDDCGFPYKGLAGVGVAFNLVVALRTRFREIGVWEEGAEPNLREYLDLVALGTVADVVPLNGQNRVFVTFGLKEIDLGARPGIRSLKEVAGLTGNNVAARDLGFRLAPRLNAAGRLGEAVEGVRLMTTQDQEEALRLATKLNVMNDKRKRIEGGILTEARHAVRRLCDDEGMRSAVVASDQWHPGVLGIVASRLVSEFHVPTILISLADGFGRGSGRSVDGFDLFRGMQACAEHLVGFGGHRAAGGLRIEEGAIEAFRKSFDTIVTQEMEGKPFEPLIEVDAAMGLAEISAGLVSDIESLAPFGEANPEVVLYSEEVNVLSQKVVGKDHLKLRVGWGKAVFDAIGFGMGGHHPLPSKRVSLIFTPFMNEYNGRRSIELRIIDILI